MSLLPSVQPFHAIAYPIDPILALEIRYDTHSGSIFCGCGRMSHFLLYVSCSCKYAAHCSVVASRFGLSAFNHPATVPVKRDGGNRRLKVGYVSTL